MKLTALGTGTSHGVPMIGCQCEVCLSNDPRDKRLRSSVFIETANNKILIDIGPDFRQQFLDNQLTTLDAIIITHEHNDHVVGLDDVRAINFIQQKSVPIYAENRVLDSIRKRFSYAFDNGVNPGVPQIVLNEISEDAFELNGDMIEPLRIMHGRLPILGYKINDLVYITDAKNISENVLNKIFKCKFLIINALRIEQHYSHFTLEEALAFIKKIEPQKAFITHISHAMGLTKEWSALLPPNVQPLQDKMIINVTKDAIINEKK